MGLSLLALFVLWLLAEYTALVWVADLLGSTLDALALLLLISLVGAWFTKQAGLGRLRRIQAATAQGQLPSRELTGGLVVLIAGFLLVVPGYVSGAIGAALLLPPVRAAITSLVLRRLARGGSLLIVGGRTRRTRNGSGGATEVWDVESWEEPQRGNRREGREIRGGPP